MREPLCGVELMPSQSQKDARRHARCRSFLSRSGCHVFACALDMVVPQCSATTGEWKYSPMPSIGWIMRQRVGTLNRLPGRSVERCCTLLSLLGSLMLKTTMQINRHRYFRNTRDFLKTHLCHVPSGRHRLLARQLCCTTKCDSSH